LTPPAIDDDDVVFLCEDNKIIEEKEAEILKL